MAFICEFLDLNVDINWMDPFLVNGRFSHLVKTVTKKYKHHTRSKKYYK